MTMTDLSSEYKLFTRIFLILAVSTLVFLPACSPTPPPQEEVTLPADIGIPTHTPMPVCSPPPCTEGESYHCPDKCVGGCGTVCATHTPVASTEEIETVPSESELPDSVQVFPDPAGYQWEPVVTGLDKPLFLTHAGDGSGFRLSADPYPRGDCAGHTRIKGLCLG